MNTNVRHFTFTIAAIVAVLATSVAHASSMGPVTAASLDGFSDRAVSGAPTVYASDDFAGTPGSNLNGRTLTVGGNAWSVAAGTWSINATNQAESPGVALGRAITPTKRANARIVVTVRDNGLGGGTSGVVMRSDLAASTFLSASTQTTSGSIVIAKRQGGSSTILVTATGVVVTNPATFVVELNGANIKVLYNGTTSINYNLTTTDQTTFGSLSAHGLLNDNAATVRYDDFRVESL